MDHKQLLLHELLQQDQDPFHLDTYISDKRSHLNSSSSQLARRTSAVPETCTNPCFFSSTNSPDVRKPPFIHFLSPAISPCRSPCADAFLHVPSRTAAVLVEAAMRIQKQRQSKPKAQITNVGLSLFGSFLKILKHRSKNKVFLSPATSPIRGVKQEKENSEGVHNAKGVEEQRSPVSVLDSLLEDDDDLERSYANIERARRKLLDRLRRFEKLASLDPVELVDVCKAEGVGTASSLKQRVNSASTFSSVVEIELDEWAWERSVVEETAAEMEVAILGRLMEELSDDLDVVVTQCSFVNC